MESIFKLDKEKRITKPEDIVFTAKTASLYGIEISARVKGEKQIGGADDEDLRIEIDKRKFPQLHNPERYFDSPASFSGGTLHGLKKTVYFILPLSAGKHAISLIPDISATILKIEIFKVSDTPSVDTLALEINDQAEDGDRRPWITFVLIDLALKQLTVELILKRRFIDSDDIKIIVDGNTKKNDKSILHKFWYFVASLFIGEAQIETFIENLPPGLHYIEFWADRMPIFQSITLKLEQAGHVQLKHYQDTKLDRNYNQLDGYILEATNFWNNFFLNQKYPPPEQLDPNLVKAILYRESKLGYYPNQNIIDVMQVWDPANPAKDAILGKTVANEFINQGKIGHMSYSYPKDKTLPKVEMREESIFWAVRWLFHKAQYLLEDDKGGASFPYTRKWRNWKEAIRGYNANPKLVDEYIKEVFSIYEKGVDLEGNSLWL